MRRHCNLQCGVAAQGCRFTGVKTGTEEVMGHLPAACKTPCKKRLVVGRWWCGGKVCLKCKWSLELTHTVGNMAPTIPDLQKLTVVFTDLLVLLIKPLVWNKYADQDFEKEIGNGSLQISLRSLVVKSNLGHLPDWAVVCQDCINLRTGCTELQMLCQSKWLTCSICK